MNIQPLQEDEIDELAALARRIWQAHYLGIITQEQIDYMLAERYSPQRLADELKTASIGWDVVRSENAMLGFASCLLHSEPQTMKLDKIYVAPEAQRQGIGAALIAHVAERARQAGCGTLILAVNKRNEKAIAAYRKHGFTVRESVCVAIGNGFVMDDYIMSKSLHG